MEKEQYNRPTWDEYFYGEWPAPLEKSSCDRGPERLCHCRDKQYWYRICRITQGLPHCDEVGHLMKAVHRRRWTCFSTLRPYRSCRAKMPICQQQD